MRVTIDENLCTGHGRCYSLASDVFDGDERGLGMVRIDGELPAELEAQARTGAANCPEQAITVG